jgi:3-deoxy-D-manno-octulosonate 8-phosphate phosphatase (KDO 8-P phosphatase)
VKLIVTPNPTARLRKLFAPVRGLLLDVDGVLTDGTIFLGDGIELKRFNIHDGYGIVLARRAGIKVGFISARESAATARRATELGVELVIQSPRSKAEAVCEAQRRLSVPAPYLCFVGDDVIDLPALRRVGAPVAVANAAAEVKAAAQYVTSRAGGNGAVREVVELILKSQRQWEKLIGSPVKSRAEGMCVEQ